MKKQTAAPKKKSVVGEVILYRKLEQIEKLMIAQHSVMLDWFEKLEKMIARENANIEPALEHQIDEAAIRTRNIDKMVRDQKQSPRNKRKET